MMLTPEEVLEDMVSAVRIFLFGTLSLTHEPIRSATQRAVALAKAAGAVISFYPNLRPSLWGSLEEAWGRSLVALPNAAAYLVTTKNGAIKAMPTREQVLGAVVGTLERGVF